ncbi:crossover junction endodeoxyribonuclease RuvC [bacterium]|nr:crossover junction endodeoxyribonuclease RuvC [bacterium]
MSRVILGLDPGNGRTGYGAVRQRGDEVEFVECGCISTNPKHSREERLLDLHRQLSALFERIRPQVAAVEELFFSRNVTTAITVGEARGVILLAAAQNRVAVSSYNPMSVKEAVAGAGKAGKPEMTQAVMYTLNLQEKPRPDDAADGLALALCHLFWESIEG